MSSSKTSTSKQRPYFRPSSASASLAFPHPSPPYAPGHVPSRRTAPVSYARADMARDAEARPWIAKHSPARHLPFEGVGAAAAVATAPPMSFRSLGDSSQSRGAGDGSLKNYLSDEDASSAAVGGRGNYLSDNSDDDAASNSSNRSQSPQWRLRP